PTQTCSRHVSSLHSISADNPFGRNIFDDQVMTGCIELVQITVNPKRRLKTFSELQVEDLESQLEDLVHVLPRLSESDTVIVFADFSVWNGVSEEGIVLAADRDTNLRHRFQLFKRLHKASTSSSK